MLAEIVVKIVKILCPLLRDMANRTDSDLDNVVVDIICRLVGGDPE